MTEGIPADRLLSPQSQTSGTLYFPHTYGTRLRTARCIILGRLAVRLPIMMPDELAQWVPGVFPEAILSHDG